MPQFATQNVTQKIISTFLTIKILSKTPKISKISQNLPQTHQNWPLIRNHMSDPPKYSLLAILATFDRFYSFLSLFWPSTWPLIDFIEQPQKYPLFQPFLAQICLFMYESPILDPFKTPVFSLFLTCFTCVRMPNWCFSSCSTHFSSIFDQKSLIFSKICHFLNFDQKSL